MDELKLLIEMVSNLPSLAVWVLVGYLVYKVAVVGSIYGVLRFGIEKAHDYLVKRKTIPPEVRTVEIRPMLEGIAIPGLPVDALMFQLRRVIGKNLGIRSDYIHGQSVDWLREAIDDKIAKDAAAEKK